MLDLDAIFGDCKTPPALTTTKAAATAPVQPGLVQPGDGRPDNLGDQAGGPTSIPERTSAAIPAAAIDATAGQVDDLGDLLPADGEWDSLPTPEPCKVCGEVLAWWDMWGTRHCSVCEPAGRRSIELAEQAERLKWRTCQKSARSIR